MPASLSIKNVSDETLARLRMIAKRHRRSLQMELLAILEEAIRPQRLSISELRQRVDELGLRTHTDSTRLIRRERDAR